MRRGTLSTAILAAALAGAIAPAVEIPIRRNDADDFDRLIRKRAKERWGDSPPRRNTWKQEARFRARRAETPAQSAARRSKELKAQKRKSRQGRAKK